MFEECNIGLVDKAKQVETTISAFDWKCGR